MKFDVFREEAELPPVKTVVVTFTADDFLKLAVICGSIGGQGELRTLGNEIYHEAVTLFAPSKSLLTLPRYRSLHETIKTSLTLQGVL